LYFFKKYVFYKLLATEADISGTEENPPGNLSKEPTPVTVGVGCKNF
jgi:hypothetical protein